MMKRKLNPLCHQGQTEEKRETEPPASTSTEQMKPESDGEYFGPIEPASNLNQDGDLQPTGDGYLSSDCCESEIEDNDDDENKTREPHSGLDTTENNEISNERSAENKPFSCSVCGKGFSKRGYMKKHMIMHTGEKHFSCSVCGKVFSQRGSMQSHMRIHTGDKPFSCSVCGKGFSEKGNMQRHMIIHTGDKPFSCPVCVKGFSQRGHMQSHMRIHTGDKPFSCSVCGKGFSQTGNMQRHTRIHTGDKPFSCSVCGKRFSERGNLQRHTRIHTDVMGIGRELGAFKY
ncbi:gastrula zinc finger protein XlCGF7.1-like [Lampris incognitus]|uniref:gastrula zinc finger protein XlCGF7.1-like n=1 Tax=Lampris incognitus TaxID=2546036 RepID=UPI0024B58B0C|nr:gastrula zinc finger protein XlCGF7.1-like [Lampris incognitus]